MPASVWSHQYKVLENLKTFCPSSKWETIFRVTVMYISLIMGGVECIFIYLKDFYVSFFWELSVEFLCPFFYRTVFPQFSKSLCTKRMSCCFATGVQHIFYSFSFVFDFTKIIFDYYKLFLLWLLDFESQSSELFYFILLSLQYFLSIV